MTKTLILVLGLLLAAPVSYAVRCTGKKSCRTCTNCSRCKHCNSGGKCGVCSRR